MGVLIIMHSRSRITMGGRGGDNVNCAKLLGYTVRVWYLVWTLRCCWCSVIAVVFVHAAAAAAVAAAADGFCTPCALDALVFPSLVKCGVTFPAPSLVLLKKSYLYRLPTTYNNNELYI